MKATHAGGLVYRIGGNGDREYLMVTASSGDWVLPKGHIEPGETDEEAAVREVLEEAGVKAALVRHIAHTEPYDTRRENNIVVTYYLMEYISEDVAVEDRKIKWCSLDEAKRSVKHEALNQVLAIVE